MSILSKIASTLADTDSYKLSHPWMYPEALEMSAYFTYRKPLHSDDHRIVHFGQRHIFEELLSQRITMEDIELMDFYTSKHMAGGVQFEWPRDLWVKVVEENGGYLPYKVWMLPEGTVTLPNVPGYFMTAPRPYDRLITWMESAMMRMWSGATTATRSAHIHNRLSKFFSRSVDEGEIWRLTYALQDFGSRGVSSKESGAIAGSGHLLSFDGTDNINAAIMSSFWAKAIVGQSVYASEHSVMTAWPTEEDALEHFVSNVCPPGSILSCVADTYDYDNFIWNIVPKFVEKLRAKGIYFVVRPDSGDPVKCVVDGLRAMDKAFGSKVNSLGYKVIDGAGVIQGDGIDEAKLIEIATAVEEAGYSAQCVVYGMGGGLLQKQNRDSLSAANKLCSIRDMDGTYRNAMKLPKEDGDKFSLPGLMYVKNVGGVPTVFPGAPDAPGSMLKLVWDMGPVGYEWDDFNAVRDNLKASWAAHPEKGNHLSPEMEAVVRKEIAFRRGL